MLMLRLHVCLRCCAAPMPDELSSRGAASVEAAAASEAVLRAATALLRRALREPFCLTKLNLGATSFTDALPAARPAAARLLSALAGGGGSGGSRAQEAAPAGATLSKQQARQLRERPPEQHACGASDDGGASDDDAMSDYASADEDEADDGWALLRHCGARGGDEDAAAPSPQQERWQQCAARASQAARQPAVSPAPRHAGASSDLRSIFSSFVPAGTAAIAAAAPFSAPRDGDAPPCAKCGRAVPAAERAEHADWHLARELQREENASAAAANAAANTAKRPAPAGPLDAFLRRGGAKR
jgi:hypothetical protein